MKSLMLGLKLLVGISLTEVEDYTVNIGGAAINAVTKLESVDEKINFRCKPILNNNVNNNSYGQQVDTGELSESGINVGVL
jgi:hypothetical protein